MVENKLISLCIPTNGKVDFVLPVLESIYGQGVDDNLFEVVITDNGENSVLEEAIEVYWQHDNLLYYKSKLNGFVNQVDAFKHSNGLFIKMLNHRATLLPGALSEMISLIEKYKETQPCMYFTDGFIKGEEIIECVDFDTFVRKMSYLSSWSAGVGIWSIDKTVLDNIEYNKMFPHASIIFEIRQESGYVIWNKTYMSMTDDLKKGGYNLFHTFAVEYLDLLKDMERRGRITTYTFNSVKKDLLAFLKDLFYMACVAKNSFTFDLSGTFKYITTYYSVYDYISIVGAGIVRRISILLNKLRS